MVITEQRKNKDKYRSSKTEHKFFLKCHDKYFNVTKKGYPDFLVYQIDKKKNEFKFCFVEVKKGRQKLRGWQKWIFAIFKHYGLPIYLLRDGEIPSDKHFRVIPYKEFRNIKDKL